MNKELMERASDIVAEYLQNDGKASHIAEAVLRVAIDACLAESVMLRDECYSDVAYGVLDALDERIRALLADEPAKEGE